MGIYVNMIITIIHANKVRNSSKKHEKAQRELQRKYKDNHKEKYRITKKSAKN